MDSNKTLRLGPIVPACRADEQAEKGRPAMAVRPDPGPTAAWPKVTVNRLAF